MSLIKCPECGKKFSDKASMCPNCSCPTSEVLKNIKPKEKKPKKEDKPIKKKINKKTKITILIVISSIILICILSLLFLTVFNKNWKNATEEYKKVYSIAEKKNDDINELIEMSEKLVYSDNKALDEELRPLLETRISEAKAAKKKLPKKPLLTKDINKAIDELKEIDYLNEYNNLRDAYLNLDTSIKKYKLVDNPTEAFVIDRLKNITHIKNIAAVTEDNDPNGHLNKAGGYTATVYYSDDRIKLDKSVYGNTTIDQGTEGGGAIEVYANEEDANKRNDYLASFDGGPIDSGSHIVIGTVIIRTSSELTASQQKEMEQLIIEALTRLEDEQVNIPTYEETVVEESEKEEKPQSNSGYNEQSTSNNNTSNNSKIVENAAKEIYANKYMNIGRTSMLKILVNEKNYSESESRKALETCCDWKTGSVVVADNLFCNYSMYPNFVKDSLKSEGFKDDEITYAINNSRYDWNELAVTYTRDTSAKVFSKNEIKQELNKLGFTETQQNYGLENSGINWNNMAHKYAEDLYYKKGTDYSYCNEHGGHIGNTCPVCGHSIESTRTFSCSRSECTTILINAGFTEAQASYAINGYSDSFFVPPSEQRNYLAYYTLSKLIVNNNKPTREWCTNKLTEWGFSSNEIQYANSKFSDSYFSH